MGTWGTFIMIFYFCVFELLHNKTFKLKQQIANIISIDRTWKFCLSTSHNHYSAGLITMRSSPLMGTQFLEKSGTSHCWPINSHLYQWSSFVANCTDSICQVGHTIQRNPSHCGYLSQKVEAQYLIWIFELGISTLKFSVWFWGILCK